MGKNFGQKKCLLKMLCFGKIFRRLRIFKRLWSGFWRDLGGDLHWASVGYVEMCGGNLG